MKKIGTAVAFNQTLTISASSYPNGRLAIVLDSTDGSPFATFSANLIDMPAPGENEFFAKTYSENEALREPLLNSGLFRDTGNRVTTEFGQIEVWALT